MTTNLLSIAATLKAYLIVFMASACGLILEILAARILAPNIGVSLYTWTGIIGVVLAGISIGNYLGGSCSAPYPTNPLDRCCRISARWAAPMSLAASTTRATVQIKPQHFVFHWELSGDFIGNDYQGGNSGSLSGAGAGDGKESW